MKNEKEEVKDTISLELIKKLLNALQELQEKVESKTIQLGNFGEIVVSSMLGMKLLPGTTMRGPDAIVDSDNSYLKKGRYQIKYRNEEISDIQFRVDTHENGELLNGYEWDGLLVATHKNKKIIPDNFYCIPFSDAIELSEDLGEKKSEHKQNSYHLYRINWTFNRKNGKGNVGRKKEYIEKKYKINSSKKFLFSNVEIIEN
ncbi:MAG: hypothetical protein ACP5RX_02865 [Minisyncoccia bacterium]